MAGFNNISKNKERYNSKILRIWDYLKGVSLARQQINYLKPIFVDNCDGDILEIGGFDTFFKKSYKCGSFINYDIVPGPAIDIVGDAENMVEISDESFSSVICISVLEHTPNPENMIKEIYRVLKKNGKAYISVPWIFQMHMEPRDFLRFSDFYMLKMFEKTGFTVHSKYASNSIYGTIAHFLQINRILRFTLGFLFVSVEQLSNHSFKYCTQINYFLSKKD